MPKKAGDGFFDKRNHGQDQNYNQTSFAKIGILGKANRQEHKSSQNLKTGFGALFDAQEDAAAAVHLHEKN